MSRLGTYLAALERNALVIQCLVTMAAAADCHMSSTLPPRGPHPFQIDGDSPLKAFKFIGACKCYAIAYSNNSQNAAIKLLRECRLSLNKTSDNKHF